MNKKALGVVIGLILAITMIVGVLIWKSQSEDGIEQVPTKERQEQIETEETPENVLERKSRQEKIEQPPAKEKQGQVETEEMLKGETGWKAYKSEEYGFEFQYPKDWEAKEMDNGVYAASKEVRGDLPEGGRVIKFEVINIGLEDVIDNYELADEGVSKITKNEKYDFSGVEARKLTGTTAIGIDENLIFAERDSKNYLIRFNDFDQDHLNILGTFKFVD